MFSWIKKVTKDCLTENDGQSYDFPRVLAAGGSAAGFPTFLGLSIYHVFVSPDHGFDMQSFGTAFATMLAGIAAVAGTVAFKQRTDTQPPQDGQGQ